MITYLINNIILILLIFLNLGAINEFDSDEESDSGSEMDESMDVSGIQFRAVDAKLSKHFPCASHTLNLLATTDFNKIMNSASSDVKAVHKISFNR